MSKRQDDCERRLRKYAEFHPFTCYLLFLCNAAFNGSYFAILFSSFYLLDAHMYACAGARFWNMCKVVFLSAKMIDLFKVNLII